MLVGENPNATRAFRQGYERTRELTLDNELESQYVRLAIIKSAQDGEWCRRNTAIETAAWADGLTEWYRSRFG